MVAFRGRPGRTMAPQRPASAGAGLPGRTIPHSARAPGPFPPRRPPQSSRLSPRPGLPAGPRLGGTIAPGDGEGGCCPRAARDNPPPPRDGAAAHPGGPRGPVPAAPCDHHRPPAPGTLRGSAPTGRPRRRRSLPAPGNETRAPVGVWGRLP